ncbi:MAG TPA: hypothetical protein VI757_16030 [Bacteroidia bacterium]|nr:hypothetical protein [Bacteroidia bacterium]
MGKNIFTLNNTGIHHDYSAMAFVTFETLLHEQESGARGFMNSIGYFTDSDFHALNKRIQITGDKQVGMNEKQLIIFYSVVHFACIAFVDEKEIKFLRPHFNPDLGDLLIMKEKLLQFGTVVSEKLRREYSHLKDFNFVAEKISID